MEHLIHEVAKFGTVGAVAFVINVLVFNVLSSIGSSHGRSSKPVTATVIATVISTAVAYLGNRHWTYRDRGSRGKSRDTFLFFLVNAIAAVIQVVCVAVSHYVLGFHGRLADNIANYPVGTTLGMIFRFWTYRTWIFPKVHPEPAEVRPEVAPSSAIVR